VCFWLYPAKKYNPPLSLPLPGAQPSISNAEGDILFLLDSSGSVSYYEFSKVKEFMWDLVRPFSFGPKDVQTSIIHISTTPTMEFPFDRYQSRGGVQQAIRDTRQLMGDTNTGQALSYAKEKFFSNEAGARPEVPKVLVWVTDGFSTDDISEPMQLLKDMGVTVFIVSTGRGNYLELSAAASQPPEKHLHFVDVDDLPIITKELRDAMLDVIQANRLHAVDITSSSFRLVWPELLSQETGYYSLEYAPTNNLAAKRTTQLSGAHTSFTVSNLTPETTYEVALVPESNVHYFPPQTTRVTTLAGKMHSQDSPCSAPHNLLVWLGEAEGCSLARPERGEGVFLLALRAELFARAVSSEQLILREPFHPAPCCPVVLAPTRGSSAQPLCPEPASLGHPAFPIPSPMEEPK
uniref:von Willebrand factor A domain-containing protein 1 n=1 Tax=Anas zonorhyncha TaxID=75864 RepID=A0A8B9V414_9AVES